MDVVTRSGSSSKGMLPSPSSDPMCAQRSCAVIGNVKERGDVVWRSEETGGAVVACVEADVTCVGIKWRHAILVGERYKICTDDELILVLGP